jgi:hypothetical protein
MGGSLLLAGQAEEVSEKSGMANNRVERRISLDARPWFVFFMSVKLAIAQ